MILNHLRPGPVAGLAVVTSGERGVVVGRVVHLPGLLLLLLLLLRRLLLLVLVLMLLVMLLLRLLLVVAHPGVHGHHGVERGVVVVAGGGRHVGHLPRPRLSGHRHRGRPRLLARLLLGGRGRARVGAGGASSSCTRRCQEWTQLNNK